MHRQHHCNRIHDVSRGKDIMTNHSFFAIMRKQQSFSGSCQVQAAVHVRSPGYCWSVCSAAPGWDYEATQPNLPRDIYPTLVKKLKVIIYNGECFG